MFYVDVAAVDKLCEIYRTGCLSIVYQMFNAFNAKSVERFSPFFFTLLSKKKKKKNPKNLSTRWLAVTHGARCTERGAQSARTVLHILRGHVQMWFLDLKQ